jgi:dGTPase
MSEALAPYACHPASTRGRRFFEPAAPTRTDFQRDRDRIVHSTAFRRLVYKTQVFLNHEGDLFRTRLTHSLEVAQLARSMARTLRLNEDLVEAIALAHDLGHTPFGHAGQDALNACMTHAARGGFEHNLQSLRVVDELEERYPDYDGLNLCFETREGILKHCSRANAERLEAAEPGGVGHRFVQRLQPSLEAQLCNLADEVAYNAHDVDDGIRSGLLSMAQLEEVELLARYRHEALAQHPQLTHSPRRLLYETLRRMLSAQVYDVIDSTQSAIDQAAPANVDAVRASPPLVSFGPEMKRLSAELKRFLLHRLYRHPQVMHTTRLAQGIVTDLFDLYLARPEEMQAGFAQRVAASHNDSVAGGGLASDDAVSARVVADYIAGMTDRFATREHARLTGVQIAL